MLELPKVSYIKKPEWKSCNKKQAELMLQNIPSLPQHAKQFLSIAQYDIYSAARYLKHIEGPNLLPQLKSLRTKRKKNNEQT